METLRGHLVASYLLHFLNFLRGMETLLVSKLLRPAATFLNFLRGMETHPGRGCRLDVGHFLNFLRGMETPLDQRVVVVELTS